MDPALVIAIAAVVLAPLATLLTNNRKFSGQVASSDADALWKESGDIRELLSQQLKDRDTRILDLEKRVADQEHRANELLRENYMLTIQRTTNEALITELRGKIAALEERLRKDDPSA